MRTVPEAAETSNWRRRREPSSDPTGQRCCEQSRSRSCPRLCWTQPESGSAHVLVNSQFDIKVDFKVDLRHWEVMSVIDFKVDFEVDFKVDLKLAPPCVDTTKVGSNFTPTLLAATRTSLQRPTSIGLVPSAFNPARPQGFIFCPGRHPFFFLTCGHSLSQN